jgi:hypothetical protein
LEKHIKPPENKNKMELKKVCTLLEKIYLCDKLDYRSVQTFRRMMHAKEEKNDADKNDIFRY